jgi:uncharacterized damage-inducible protein DinB
MTVDFFIRMFDYNFWAHRRVWDYVMALTAEQFTRPSDYSIGSIHAQIVHTIGAEQIWLRRVKGEPTASFPKTEQYPTRSDIRAVWDQVETDWRAYLAQVSDAHLTEFIDYKMTDGSEQKSIRWEAMMQVINHGTDHRAQTLALIHQVGGQTNSQDFIHYVRERP